MCEACVRYDPEFLGDCLCQCYLNPHVFDGEYLVCKLCNHKFGVTDPYDPDEHELGEDEQDE